MKKALVKADAHDEHKRQMSTF